MILRGVVEVVGHTVFFFFPMFFCPRFFFCPRINVPTIFEKKKKKKKKKIEKLPWRLEMIGKPEPYVNFHKIFIS